MRVRGLCEQWVELGGEGGDEDECGWCGERGICFRCYYCVSDGGGGLIHDSTTLVYISHPMNWLRVVFTIHVTYLHTSPSCTNG